LIDFSETDFSLTLHGYFLVVLAIFLYIERFCQNFWIKFSSYERAERKSIERLRLVERFSQDTLYPTMCVQSVLRSRNIEIPMEKLYSMCPAGFGIPYLTYALPLQQF